MMIFLKLGMMDTNMIEVVIESGSPDAVSWKRLVGGRSRYCIKPEPFGKQCTAFVENALRACLGLQGCVSLVCPAPRQVHLKSLAGRSICQARSHSKRDEKNHAMCRGQLGCTHLTLVAYNDTNIDNFRIQGGVLLFPLIKKKSLLLQTLLQPDPSWRQLPTSPINIGQDGVFLRAFEIPPLSL